MVSFLVKILHSLSIVASVRLFLLLSNLGHDLWVASFEKSTIRTFQNFNDFAKNIGAYRLQKFSS